MAARNMKLRTLAAIGREDAFRFLAIECVRRGEYARAMRLLERAQHAARGKRRAVSSV